MVRMKALTKFKGEEGRVKRGREFDAADERRAAELESHGLAVRVGIKAQAGAPLNKMDPAPANKLEAVPTRKDEPERPLHLVGGETGAENVLSSPQRVQAPRMRRSRSQEDAPE